ncbi:MAG: hypothetical protein ACI4B9_00565 [Eggerthellaceae bacterium]
MGSELAEIPVLARSAVEHEHIFKLVLSHYEGTSRKNRQHAAGVFNLISQEHPESLIPIIPSLLDGLERPEAQTRWNTLEALEHLIPLAPDQCIEAFDGAEDALFNDKDGFLREKAFSFLCALASLSSEVISRVWPLLDEAVQCYHGNPEFPAMLASLLRFTEYDLPQDVKDALKERLAFDAKNNKGTLGKRSLQIIESL